MTGPHSTFKEGAGSPVDERWIQTAPAPGQAASNEQHPAQRPAGDDTAELRSELERQRLLLSRQDEELRRLRQALEQANVPAYPERPEHPSSDGEAYFRSLFEEAPVPYHSLDSEGRLLDISATWLERFGYERGEVIGRAIDDFLGSEARPFTHCQTRDGLFVADVELQRKDGTAVLLRAESRIHSDSDGRFLRLHSVLFDIGEQKQSEAALRESEKRLRDTLDHAPVLVFIKDIRGRYLFANRRCAELLNAEPSAIVGKTTDELFAPEVANKLIANDRWVLSGQGCRQVEESLPVNGAWRTFLSTQFPLTDLAGNIYATCGISTDITERKRTEALNHKLAAIIEASSDLIATAKADGRVEYLNRAGRALLGIGATESLLHTAIEDYHPAWAYQRIVEAGLPAAFEFGRWQGDNAMLTRSGTEVPVSQMILAQKDAETGELECVATVCRDITERQRTETALRKLQQEQELILDSVPAMIFYKDTANHLLRVNARVAEALGLPKDRIEGRHSSEFFPEEAERYYQDDLIVIQTGLPRFGIEEPIQVAAGQSRWLSTDKVPLKDADGRVTGVLVMATDITERKLIAEALQERERRLSESQRIAHIGSWSWDLSETLSWSEETFRIYGVSPETFTPTIESLVECLHPDDRSAMQNWIAACAAGDAPPELEFRTVLHDGRVRHLTGRGELQRDERQSPLRIAGTVQDITERKLAEEALRHSQEDLSRAQALGKIGSWRLDPRTASITWSAETHRIFATPADAPIAYEDFLCAVHPDDRDYVDRMWQAGLRGEPYEIEHRIVVDGQVKWVSEKAELGFDERGQLISAFGTVQDITERKLAEAALREADRRKDEFIATLAHELRNPLAPIGCAAQILQMPNTGDDERTRCSEVIERQVGHLTRLVDDLLDISRITRGKISLDWQKVAVEDIVERALESSRPLLETHQHQLDLRLPSASAYVEGDPIRLAQVVSNLLNNAAKYTEPGGHIALTAEHDGDGINIRVKDDGIGIPPALLSQVFEMFSQVDQSLEKTHGGLGIGLSLARELIGLHGGSITAHSAGEGQGSEFVVWLPAAVAPSERAPAAPEAAPAQSHPLRLLVADDNRDAGNSLAALLRALGHEVHIARDGLEAIAAAEAHRPEFILMDIGMPKLNGYDACRRIREHAWGRDIVITALTGWGQDSDRQLSQEAGFSHHLTKPVDFSVLRQLINAMPPTG